jgi:hypothetical protein
VGRLIARGFVAGLIHRGSIYLGSMIHRGSIHRKVDSSRVVSVQGRLIARLIHRLINLPYRRFIAELSTENLIET